MRVVFKALMRSDNPLESRGWGWGVGGGDEKTWESPNLLVPHPDVCSL